MSRVLRFLSFLGIAVASAVLLWMVGIVLLILFDKDHHEYEEFDPDLHGKTLKLNAEMVYFVNTPERPLGAYTGDYEKLLFSKSDIDGFRYKVVFVDPGMEFTVLKSFWTRMGWLSRKIASTENESRLLVLKDRNGEISICPTEYLEEGVVYLDEDKT